MKIVKIVLFVLLAAVLVVVLSILMFFLRNKPTKGEPIGVYENGQAALLVIDTQEVYLKGQSPTKPAYPDQTEVIDRINTLQQAFSGQSLCVIHIRHIFNGFSGALISKLMLHGQGVEGTPGVQMDPRILPLGDAEFTKHIGDAFSNPELGKFLMENHINRLYLTGLDGEFCVHNTAVGALNRGYEVVLVTDAMLMQRPTHRSALLQKYKDEGARLLNTEQVLTEH